LEKRVASVEKQISELMQGFTLMALTLTTLGQAVEALVGKKPPPDDRVKVVLN
jgi:hypothetical protein